MSDPAISLAALTVLEVSPREAIGIAAQCGYSHIGLRPLAATPAEPQPTMLHDAAEQADLLAALDGEGLAVLDIEIARLTPEMDWAHLDRVLDFGARFGCHRLLVADNDPDPARSAENLSRLADLGAVRGVVPCLEFMPWTCAPDLAAARDRIAGIAHAAMLVDAFHLARSGGTPGQIAIDDPRISYLQLCDIAGPIPPMDEILREARSDRLFPGDGEVPLGDLIARLPGRPISLEIPSDRLRDSGVAAAERARRAIDATRRLLSGIAPRVGGADD